MDKQVKAIIIDDEEDAVNFIHSIIKEFCPEIEVVGTAHSVKEGVDTIVKTNPEIVFLDVEMPNGTGFDLLEQFNKIDFEVIFITAYNHYAIKAIKYSAVDYILKPINIEELVDAVQKVIHKRKDTTIKSNYEYLLQNLQSNTPKKLAIPTRIGLEYISTKDIIRIEADRSYSNVFLSGKKKVMVSRNLVEFQELLVSKNFFRCHNSHLVNLDHVKMYSRTDGGFLVMSDETQIPISRSKKDIFVAKMKDFSIHLEK
jgi:two-component system, LytTR family, response regulator